MLLLTDKLPSLDFPQGLTKSGVSLEPLGEVHTKTVTKSCLVRRRAPVHDLSHVPRQLHCGHAQVHGYRIHVLIGQQVLQAYSLKD